MYGILLKLMLLAALFALGAPYSTFFSCNTQDCQRQVEKRSRDILKIDWKPISVFPEEAKRFQLKHQGQR